MSDATVLLDCVNFAAIKHRTQMRLDQKTPYINHPIGVAHILSSEAGVSDLIVLQAAILHDTVEDTDTTFDEIEKAFGTEVCAIVREVTDDKSLPSATRKQLQIEHAPASSEKAKLVKLADKLYNLRDLERCTPLTWSEERVQQYFEWSKKVVKGLRGVNDRMEKELDAIFKRRDVI